MQYAEHLPRLSSPRTMLAPLVALVVGAAAAAGAYNLVDRNESVFEPAATKVIVAPAPAPPSEGVRAKDEAASAASIAAGPELRGSKASQQGAGATERPPGWKYGTSQYRLADPER